MVPHSHAHQSNKCKHLYFLKYPSGKVRDYTCLKKSSKSGQFHFLDQSLIKSCNIHISRSPSPLFHLKRKERKISGGSLIVLNTNSLFNLGSNCTKNYTQTLLLEAASFEERNRHAIHAIHMQISGRVFCSLPKHACTVGTGAFSVVCPGLFICCIKGLATRIFTSYLGFLAYSPHSSTSFERKWPCFK